MEMEMNEGHQSSMILNDVHLRDRRNLFRRESLKTQKDENGHGREAGDKAPPQPDDSHTQAEAEKESDRQADDPVTNDVAYKRKSSVRRAMKHSDPRRLQSGGELKDCGYEEERKCRGGSSALIEKHAREQRGTG